MKIPEVSPNGPYYGNEENSGQWQRVVMESGNMVGSGDAGYHGPPPHYVRHPGPGYVMPGVFYPPQNTYGAMPPPPPQQQPEDFADYMWMENEEEFEKEVMQHLEEEALMEQCIEAMLEDERERERNNRPVTNGHTNNATTSNGVNTLSLEEQVSKSTLNPLAAEFIPTFAKTTSPIETKTENCTETEESTRHDKTEAEPLKTSEPINVESACDTTDTPEVSALDTVCHKADRSKETKENKKPAKSENSKKVTKTEVKTKKSNEQPSKAKPEKLSRKKSDPVEEVTEKNEEIVQKSAESVQKVEETVQTPAEIVQKPVENVQKPVEIVEKSEEIVQKPVESVQENEVVVSAIEPVSVTPPQDEVTIKPINYAAAAKANKAKKTSPPPIQEKIERPTVKTMEKPKLVESKSTLKTKPERSGAKKNTAK